MRTLLVFSISRFAVVYGANSSTILISKPFFNPVYAGRPSATRWYLLLAKPSLGLQTELFYTISRSGLLFGAVFWRNYWSAGVVWLFVNGKCAEFTIVEKSSVGNTGQ